MGAPLAAGSASSSAPPPPNPKSFPVPPTLDEKSNPDLFVFSVYKLTLEERNDVEEK